MMTKAERDKAYYEANREARLEYQREYYRRNTERVKARSQRQRAETNKVIAEARANPCFDCGETYPPQIMQFHHRDPQTKLGEVTQFTSLRRTLEEMEKYDLLCPNCHALRHLEMTS